MKRTIKIEPLTSKTWHKVYPPIHFPVKGYAGTEDGKVLAIVCIIYANGHTFLAFENFVDMDMALKRAVIKGWKLFKKLVRDDTHVMQDKTKPTSESFIRHFGGDKWLDH